MTIMTRFPVWCCVLLFFLLSGNSVLGQEDESWAKMLQGFKDPERKYFDTALEYLHWMQTSPLCPPSLKKQIDYQVAVVHLDAIESGNTFLPRDEHIKKCRESLEKFIKENPQHDLMFDAQSTLGRLFMEEGRTAMLYATHETTKNAEREQYRVKARDNFKKALPFFEAADKLATEQAKKLQDTQKANPAAVKEDALYAAYGRFLAGKILINLTKSDIAKTYPDNSKEFKDGLTEVAKAFSALSSKYVEYTAGFEAKLYAAKAYKDLNDFKTARGLLGELNTLQGDEFLKIRNESLTMALEMNLIEKKPENYLDSINRARAWNENVPISWKISREGQQIFVLAAKNFIAYAETIKSNKAEHDKAVRDAGVFLRQVRQTYPSFAKEARELLQKIGAVKIDKGKPENFEQAKEYAEDDWREFTIAYSEFQDAQGNNKEKLKKNVDEIAQRCIASIDLAINMRETGTPMTEINALRLNLVRVYGLLGKTLEAAILADYLTQHYSGSPDADKTAIMAVRLYRQAFVEDKLAGHDSSAVAERLDKLCAFIMSRWEGQEVTGEVQLLRIETAIDNGNIEEAKKLLTETAAGTPQRVSAELKIGQSLWNRYATLSKLPEDSDEKPQKNDLDALLSDAKKQLELGLNGKIKLIQENKVKVDAASVQSALAMSQIFLNTNESEKTIHWLTNPQVGPLALIANPPATVDKTLLKNLQLSASMLLLRAYVGAEQLDKAEETMKQLETIIKEQAAESGTGTEEQKLTQIYISLGRQLENRLKELNDSGETEQADKVAQGFEMFLKRIKNRGETNTFQSLYWVADTFYRLGSGMSTDKTVSDNAAGYYKAAGSTYIDILKRLADEPDWAPERAADTIKVRLAESLRCVAPNEKDKERREKIFNSAMKYVADLLEESENRIDIQIEAAKTLESWGKNDPSKLIRAVAGRFPSAQVWGWNGIIKRTSVNVDRFSEFYYEAYWSKFRCVIDIAKNEKEAPKKEKLLTDANRDFIALIQLRPQLGGQEWFARFDQVYKSLERINGKSKPAGIKELLKTLGETQIAVQEVDNIKNKTPEEPETKTVSETPKKSKKQTKTTAKPKKDSGNFGIFIGIGIAVIFIPVAFFIVFRKKKR
ncbi:MAG: AsmA family protein [Planctomycetaceae bacterium]|nr:AsmA family protein [Planctomycetaceae bacterium]